MKKLHLLFNVLSILLGLANCHRHHHHNEVDRITKEDIVFKYDAGDTIPNQYLVTIRDDIVTTKDTSWFAKFKSKIKEQFNVTVKTHFNICDKYHAMKIHGDYDKVQELLQMTEIAHVEEDRYLKAIAPSLDLRNTTVCYTQATGRNQWGLSRISRRDKVPGGIFSKASYTWGDHDDGTGVDAYVLDTGIYLGHNEFQGRASWGFTATSFLEADDDLNGHGTHVAGTIGGRTFGVAKNVNLVAVKILNKDGVGAISDIIEGIDWMVDDFKEKEKSSKKKRGKAVANLSLGAKGVSVAMEKAILQAVDAGVNFVVAAGNDFDDACKFTPAYVPQAITVGAMGIEDITSPFSNYGVCVDIFAPGESILSAYPGAPDASAIQQGTSMASPHVAGAVARVLSRYDEPPPPLDVHDLMVEASTKDALVAKTPDTPNRLLYLTCGGVSTLVNGGAAVIGVMNLFTALSVMSSLLVVMDCRL